MGYYDVLRKIAIKENISVEEVENEMKMAIALAGLDCSVKEFVEVTAASIIKRRYIV